MKQAMRVIILLLLSFVWAASVQFGAKEALYQGKKMGEVYGNGQTVMRLLSREGALSPYGRAQVVAERLNQRITKLSDFNRVRFSYPNDIYTAILDKEKLFSIYPEEVAANGSTPESLMADWINNIKRIVAQGPKTPAPPSINVTSENAEQLVASAQVIASPQPDEFVEQERLKKEVVLLRTGLRRQEARSHSLLVPVILIINVLIILGLSLLYWRVNKKLGSLGALEKTDRLEELENSVSTLMRELHETSDAVTDKAKAVLDELDKKVEEAKTFKPERPVENEEPIRPPAEIPEPILQETPAEEEQPAPPKEETPEPEMVLEEPVPEEPPVAEPPVDAGPARSLAEQLADEIEQSVDQPSESAESLFLDDEMDPDLKAEIESVLANENMSKNEKVVALASVNIMTDEIARYLGMGLGEVELILQLAK